MDIFLKKKSKSLRTSVWRILIAFIMGKGILSLKKKDPASPVKCF